MEMFKLQSYIEPSTSLQSTTKNTLKDLYDEGRACHNNIPSTSRAITLALPQLLTDGFDHEQIWSQVELHNSEASKRLKKAMKQATLAAVGLSLIKKSSKKMPASGSEMDADMDWLEEEGIDVDADYDDGLPIDEDDENDESGGSDDNSTTKGHTSSNSKPSGPRSVVDDKFFKLFEMESFLERQDRLAMLEMDSGQRKDDTKDADDADADDDDFDNFEQFDFMDNVPSSDDDQPTGYNYADFFDPPIGDKSDDTGGEEPSNKSQHKSVRFSDAVDDGEVTLPKTAGVIYDDDESSSGDEEKSSFEKRNKRLKKRIAELEEENLGEKSWQLKGEAFGKKRPENSLLEEYLDFEHQTRPAPVITEEVTKSVEEIIRQRIKDKSWDDVERKVKSVLDPGKFKTEMVLDQQKSKMSLSQIYEQEYLKAQQTEKTEVVNTDHEDIKKRLKTLFAKLDALSHFHYTPKEITPEVRVVSNMPSISMEDVAPAIVSDATLLAPEEVKKPEIGSTIKEATEMDSTDKKRSRRKKKALVRAKVKAREAKEATASGQKMIPKDKLKALGKVGRVKVMKGSSKAKPAKDFFNQLQTQVSAEIGQKKLKVTDGDTNQRKKTAAEYKL